MPRTLERRIAVGLICTMLVGCKTYEPRPLDPAAVLAAVDEARRHPPGEPTAGLISYARAAAWMDERSPALREVRAALATAAARAGVPTPLPNPLLEFGAEYGSGRDVVTDRVGPFGSLTFTLPLGDRLAREDERNQRRAELARVEAAARHAELTLDLRSLWAQALSTAVTAEAHAELLSAAQRAGALARRMVEAGSGTALDVALFDLEAGRRHADSVLAAAAAEDAGLALAALVGVSADVLRPQRTLPELPPDVPALDVLREQLSMHHTGLARLRAAFDEADAALRLQLARQYPDLRIGPSVARETGEQKTAFGLGFGVDLPVFDRLEQSIAEAEARREEIRVRYEAQVNRALAQLERTWRAVRSARAAHAARRDGVLPAAEAGLQLARSSLAAGVGNGLHLLESERAYRTVLLEVRDAELAALEAWMDLERAVGKPLAPFPSETGAGPSETAAAPLAEGEPQEDTP